VDNLAGEVMDDEREQHSYGQSNKATYHSMLYTLLTISVYLGARLCVIDYSPTHPKILTSNPSAMPTIKPRK